MTCASCERKPGTLVDDNVALHWMETVTPKDSRLDLRKKILQFDHDFRAMCQLQPQAFDEVLKASPPLIHRFAGGVYMREITLPANSIIIGQIHKHVHFNFISKGRVRCVTEGKGVEELEGPCTLISEAGTKRILYVYEETVWTTVHRTNETTVEGAEAEAIAESYSAMGLEDPEIIQRELEG